MPYNLEVEGLTFAAANVLICPCHFGTRQILGTSFFDGEENIYGEPGIKLFTGFSRIAHS